MEDIEVEVLVTLQVSPCESDAIFPKEKMQVAALQAVANAVHEHENSGFVHNMAHDVSIGVADVELVSEWLALGGESVPMTK